MGQRGHQHQPCVLRIAPVWWRPTTASVQPEIPRTGLSYLATISGGFRYQDIYNQHVSLTAWALFAISTSYKYREIKYEFSAFSLRRMLSCYWHKYLRWNHEEVLVLRTELVFSTGRWWWWWGSGWLSLSLDLLSRLDISAIVQKQSYPQFVRNGFWRQKLF